MSTVFVDGVDLSTLGFVATGLPGWRDGPVRDWEQVPTPGRTGVVLSGLATAGPKLMQIRGEVFGDTASVRLAAIRKILAACSGERSIRFGDTSGQAITGHFRSHQVVPIAAGNEFHANTWVVLILEFLCPDPVFRDTSDSVIHLSSAPTEIPLGTLPSGGVVRINGAASNPSIVYRDASGGEVARIDLTASLGGGDWIEVDLDLCKITSSLAGNPMMLMTGGDWFRLSHEDGDYATSDWPTLELTSGSGTLTYRKVFSA